MQTLSALTGLAGRTLLALCLSWPALGQAAQEFHFEGSPDKYLPDMVPANVQRDEHKGPVPPSAGPPANYIYSWSFKDKKGIPRMVTLSYSRYDAGSTRYGYGPYTKSNTMAAFLNATGYARSRVCFNTQSGARQNYTIRATDMERRYLTTCSGDVAAEIARKPAPTSSYAHLTLHDYADKTLFDQEFRGHYGNVAVSVIIRMADDSVDAANIGLAALSKLSGKLVSTDSEPVAAERERSTTPDDAGPRLEVFALPSAVGDTESRRAYLPASRLLPAKLTAKAKPGTAVTFAIRSGKHGLLQAGSDKGQQVTVKANANSQAEAWFYYTGGKINGPLQYEVQVSKPGEKDMLTVHVGLGLAFDRIKAVKGDMRDTYPFTLTVRSRFHPKLRLGTYLNAAQSSGLWGGLMPGIRLKTSWVNMPPGTTPDQAFQGTARIIDTPEGENLLVVAHNEAKGEPQYYLTNHLYPAVVMQSDGRHAYKIDGELALLNAAGLSVGALEESLQQSDALAIVARDTPEHWLTSLACSLEVTSTEQYVMLETAKMLPVGGTAVELLTSATGLMCKFGQAEYESLFYDIGTILGGKYLDHLMEPEVFDKLTPKQQTAAKLAKKAYDDLDEYKAEQEREKWLKRPVKTAEPANEPAQNAETPKDLKDMGKSIEDNLGKSMKDLRDALKGIFKK